MSGALSLTVGGATHAGQVRENNEDCYLVDEQAGLYGVFDGMGGHHAGEVAAAVARDAVIAALAAVEGDVGRDEISAALRRASAEVFAEAERRKARRGMGTTAVLCKRVGPRTLLLAHVGDSRGYLLREGRLQQLTADHTIVAELLARGALDEDEARSHPYRAVLSRNLGSQAETRPDFRDVELQPGDRVLLCSDGLSGYASDQAIEQTLGGATDAAAAAKELVDLALKGGGGDNVTVVVVIAGKRAVPRRTQIIRTSGAAAWWERRETFLDHARSHGMAASPICSVLSEEEAIAIVAGNLCEAVYRDLEQTTGIHTWTYGENLTAGWLDQDGDFDVLRRLLDDLAAAAGAVVADIQSSDEHTGALLSVAVPRALLVADMAAANVLAKHLRQVESAIGQVDAVRARSASLTESVTVPLEVPRVDPPPPEVVACLDAALEEASHGAGGGERPREDSVVADCIARAHKAAREHGGRLDGLMAARELLGTGAHGELAVAPLLDALDRARALHVSAIKRAPGGAEVKAAAARRVLVAHRLLCCGTAHVVVDSGRPIADSLREATESIVQLRRRVVDNEQKLTGLERRFQTQPGWAPPGGRE